MKIKRSTECAVLMGLGACHRCASRRNLAFHVDFCSQIHRVRIFCGGQGRQNDTVLNKLSGIVTWLKRNGPVSITRNRIPDLPNVHRDAKISPI
jgi:hypothetical protein